MVSELDESAFFPPYTLEKKFTVNKDYSNKYTCIFTFTIALIVHSAHSL